MNVEKGSSSKISENNPVTCDSSSMWTFVSMFIQPSSEDPLEFTKLCKKSKGVAVHSNSPYIGCISIAMLEESAVPKKIVYS